MRFDAKLISADDAADDLPEDLALLGVALSLDAARLAERYPVEHGVSAPTASMAARGWRPRISKSTATRTVAAVTLVAASIALAIYTGSFRFWGDGSSWQHGAPLADQGPVRGFLNGGLLNGGFVHGATDAAAAMQVVPAATTGDLLPLRGAFFRELSGPQQEAVLDLLEEDALAQGSVSI